MGVLYSMPDLSCQIGHRLPNAKWNRMKTVISLALLAGCLSGCSLQSNPYLDTLQAATVGAPDASKTAAATVGAQDATKTAAEVAAIPYASAYLTVGDLPRAFVVLAFAEQGQMKWISADHNLFVMQHGRLVKTVGLDTDLRWIDAIERDPLSKPLDISSQGSVWQTQAEWSRDYVSGHELHSILYRRELETKDILGQSRQLLHIEEQVEDRQLNAHWRNDYWVDPASGEVVISRQQLGPKMPTIEFTLLKPL